MTSGGARLRAEPPEQALHKSFIAVASHSGITKTQPTAVLFVISETSLNWAFSPRSLKEQDFKHLLGASTARRYTSFPEKGRFRSALVTPAQSPTFPRYSHVSQQRGGRPQGHQNAKRTSCFSSTFYILDSRMNQSPPSKSLAQQRYKNINYRRRL